VLVDYMRVSKADESQTVDLQRDALLAAGVDARPTSRRPRLRAQRILLRNWVKG
jgi:hypothetical protein